MPSRLSATKQRQKQQKELAEFAAFMQTLNAKTSEVFNRNSQDFEKAKKDFLSQLESSHPQAYSAFIKYITNNLWNRSPQACIDDFLIGIRKNKDYNCKQTKAYGLMANGLVQEYDLSSRFGAYAKHKSCEFLWYWFCISSAGQLLIQRPDQKIGQ